MSLPSSSVSSPYGSNVYYQQEPMLQPQPQLYVQAPMYSTNVSTTYTTPPQPSVQPEPVEPTVSKESHAKKPKKEKSHRVIKHVDEHKPPKPEEEKDFLKKYDFIVLIDKSKSMGFEDDKKRSSWKTVHEYLSIIVSEAINHDQNGIEVGFFSDDVEWHDKVESDSRVNKLFKKIIPEGGTDLTKALKSVLHKHFTRKETNPDQRTIILVITDGEPDDQKTVESAIIHYTKKISNADIFTYNESKKTLELGIRFFQVGKDKDAKEFLEGLDHNLSEAGAKVDMVSTGNISELNSTQDVRKAFVSAIYA